MKRKKYETDFFNYARKEMGKDKASQIRLKMAIQNTKINISLPMDLVKEIQKVAKAKHLTVPDLIQEAIRQYQAQRNLKALALEGRKAVKKKRLTPKDLVTR